MSAIGADRPRTLTPLEMAQNAAAAVLRHADHQARDPLGSYVERTGTQGHQAAQLAANMALVSIAEDIHRMVRIMTGAVLLDEEEDGAIADARRTREHMRGWAAGDQDHPGEAP